MSILDNIIDSSSFVIHSVGHTKIDEKYDWNEGIKRYPHYRIYYIKESEKVVLDLVNGQVELKKGWLYFIPEFSVVKATYKYLDHFWIHFQPTTFVNNILQYFIPSQKVEAIGDEEMWYYLIYDSYKKKDVSSRFIASGAFRILFSRFLKGVDMPEDKLMRFEPILEYIDQNISKHITLKEMSDILYLDKVYFANTFKNCFGVSPIQFVNDKRIDLARKMLLTSKKQINEISDYCGFYNPLYFSRLFKNKMQMSPREYRNVVKNMTLPLPNDPL